MLRIDLSALRNGPIDMTQTVPTDDATLEGLEFQLEGGVRLAGRLSEAGPGRYYWHGKMLTQVSLPCRRCLAPVSVAIDRAMELLYTEDDSAEDPAAYIIHPRAADIDPGEAVREELILAVPDYVLCKDGCKGLCAGCGVDLNVNECTCEPEPDERWAALNALKSAQTDEGRK